MDRRDARKLQEINLEAARGGREILDKVDTFKEQREALERISKYSGASSAGKEAARKAGKMLDNPILYREDKVVNEKEAKYREKKAEYLVKKAIAKGDLPPPKMDEFQKKILKHFIK